MSFVNNTSTVSVPYYAALGFVEGAFAQNGGSNVTACRLNSIRFGNNVTLLAWYTHIRYGVDKIMLYTTELAEQLYPFSYHCYYTADEAKQLTEQDDFMNRDLDELALSQIYEMRSNTDAARRIFKLIFKVYPER